MTVSSQGAAYYSDNRVFLLAGYEGMCVEINQRLAYFCLVYIKLSCPLLKEFMFLQLCIGIYKFVQFRAVTSVHNVGPFA